MLDQLGKEKCDLILRSGSLQLIAKDPVVIREKWYQKSSNLKKMLTLLRHGFMFKEKWLKLIREVMFYMLRHNKLHVDDVMINSKNRRHNIMRKMFYDYVSTSSRGGDHDEDVPVEVECI